MKRKTAYFAILSAFSIILFAISAFRPHHTPVSIEKASSQFHTGLDAFNQSVKELQQEILLLDEHAESHSKARKAFSKARIQYKRIEFLVEYIDPEFTRLHFNGAPLPKLEQSAPSMSIVEPEGFQAMEELLYDETPEAYKSDLQKLAKLLVNNAREATGYQKKVPLTDRNVFEAVRYELIRVFSLGLTGFDSPASLNSIPEAQASFEGMQMIMEPYIADLKTKSPSLASQLSATLNNATKYLKENQDFESFDRLEFLQTYLNPLFRMTLEAQINLGIETIYETTSITQSVNYDAVNIFSNSLLNDEFYLKSKGLKSIDKKARLGQLLFFDPVLSQNNQRSCASCHDPQKAFTDSQPKSIAMDQKGTVLRNSPTLINAIYAKNFFYDLRAEFMESQIEHVVVSKQEFNTSYLEIFTKLKQSKEYQQLFKDAFPETGERYISKYTLSTALASYVRSLKGFNSSFDQYVRGERPDISPEVKQGFNLFMGKAGCGTCHFAPIFSGNVPPLFHEMETEILGVPVTTDTINPELDPDPGRFAGKVKHDAPFYKHSFKTVTVRNAALTAPYMHNGVYLTLEEVVDFYNKGGGTGLGMDVPYQTLPPDKLELSADEKHALITFMESLTDTSGMTSIPTKLPQFEENPQLNDRKIGGTY